MINEVKIVKFNQVDDLRGSLTVIEEGISCPFNIKRVFYIHNIKKERGGHAHLDTNQILICLNGSFEVKLFDGKNEKIFKLNKADEGIYIPKLIYIEMTKFTKDSIALILADTIYDIKKSIRTFEEFMLIINKQNIK